MLLAISLARIIHELSGLGLILVGICYMVTALKGEVIQITELTRIFHELLSRDREDGRATWQPQGVGFRT